ncbi:MAG: hypothetical protein ACREE0_11335 [Phenylobacterium sp.]
MQPAKLLTTPLWLGLILVLPAFSAGVQAVGWRLDQRRLSCYREFADEQLVADSKCERPRLF